MQVLVPATHDLPDATAVPIGHALPSIASHGALSETPPGQKKPAGQSMPVPHILCQWGSGWLRWKPGPEQISHSLTGRGVGASRTEEASVTSARHGQGVSADTV